MTKSLPLIKTTRKSGNERFSLNDKSLDFTLLDFWQWGSSNLVSNTYRGFLAEFIVANALGIADGITEEWAPYDLEYKGIKIEIKSGAYIQSWTQKGFSKIAFGIAPKRAWDPEINAMGNVVKRQSDLYIFCVLKHKDKETINPLNIDQWEFYVLATKILDEKLPKQKTITLSSLLRLEPVKTEYGNIGRTILEMIDL